MALVNLNNKLKKLETENNGMNKANSQLRVDNDALRKNLKLNKAPSQKNYFSGDSVPVQRLDTGEVVEARPNGNIITNAPTGDKIVTKVDGDEVEYKFSGPVVVKKPDGVRQSFMPSGDVITEHVSLLQSNFQPDGTVETKRPSGENVVTTPILVVTSTDQEGNVINIDTEKRAPEFNMQAKLKLDPDAEMEKLPNGTLIQSLDCGTVIECYPDGNITESKFNFLKIAVISKHLC